MNMAPPLCLSASRAARLRDALASPSGVEDAPNEVELQMVLADPTVKGLTINIPLNQVTNTCQVQVFRYTDPLASWIPLASI